MRRGLFTTTLLTRRAGERARCVLERGAQSAQEKIRSLVVQESSCAETLCVAPRMRENETEGYDTATFETEIHN